MSTPSKSTMRLTQAAGRKLLAGKITEPIEAGAVVVLVKRSDTEFTLHAVNLDSSDPEGPATLASFLDPDDVDAIELVAAIHTALAKPKRRRRKATASAGARSTSTTTARKRASTTTEPPWQSSAPQGR